MTTIETACGWKGSIQIMSAIAQDRKKDDALNDSVRTYKTANDSDSPTGSRTDSLGEIVEDDAMLGGEPHLLDAAVERKGVQDVLAALSDAEREQLMAFDGTMPIRHFRAEKGDADKAVKQIRETLQWRLDFGVDIIVSCFEVENTEKDTEKHKEMREVLLQEAEPGKIYCRAYDQEGRGFMYMTPARENTNNELNVSTSC